MPKLPLWMWALDFAAVVLIALGVVRLFAPEAFEALGLQSVPETVAWGFIAAGVLAMVVFWAGLVRVLRARQAARR